jgi:foldase protein PrsA
MAMLRVAGRVCALMLGAMMLAGCGTSSSSSDSGSEVLVTVVGRPAVTKAMLAHYLSVYAITSRTPFPGPQQPVPKGEIPDPPNYTACIRFTKETLPPTTNGTPPPTTTQLKAACQQHYQTLRKRVLRILTEYAWTTDEAHAQVIHATQQETQHEIALFEHENFGTEAVFQKYLKASGETLTDRQQAITIGLLANKLQQKIIHQQGITGAKTYYQNYPKHWATQTNCHPGYITEDCKQHNPNQTPEP